MGWRVTTGTGVASVVAGTGLVSTGTATNPTLNIVPEDLTIEVTADRIKVGTVSNANIANASIAVSKLVSAGTITGSRAGNAALASLLTALAAAGLIVDSTSA